MDVKEESVLGDQVGSHWYYVSKGRAMSAMLRGINVPEVLDVGAGSGVFSKRLLDERIAQRAVCVDPAYAAESAEEHGGRAISFVRSIARPDQKLVLMMDVLEHVDDDVVLLRQYTESLPRDARILISVPAFAFLWSSHDVFLEHRRRYTKRSLLRVVAEAGLEAIHSRFFFALLFPVVAAMRAVDRWRFSRREFEPRSALRAYSAPINRALVATHDIERTLLFPFNAWCGLTLFCLARPR